ncbi:response regulator [Azoarcus sp. KH32C]|uniref:response regulator n=1 Tax=Azoarcus sp. KH32C TaxID=748247 RepID=UPI0002385F1D|nr:response regulator [Azoarcus sp. KH32C]BAL25605.1 putative two-component system sensor protein [Azoarcus sp. KH32C]
MISGFLRSIRHKLLLMALIGNLGALLVAGGALVYYESLVFRQTLLDELNTQADILAYASTAALQFNDPVAARESLAQLTAQPKVLAAALYTSRGTVFATYRREDAEAKPFPPLLDIQGVQTAGGTLTLARRVASQQEVLGTVYLVARYDLTERLWEFVTVLAVAIVGSMGVGLAISTRAQRWIAGPIQSVSNVARQVMEQRNFALRATKTTDDEVGYLVDVFNDMLAEIGQRTDAIESSKRELEREIAERGEIQKSLQASERRNRTLISAMSSVIWTCGPSGGFIDEQPAWAAHTGQSRDEYRGLGWRRAFHPEDQAALDRAWALALHEHVSFELEARLWHPASARYRIVIMRNAPVLDDQDRVVEWIGALYDVDDRRAAEREVLELNAQLERRVAERTAQLEIANRALVSRTEEAEAANRAKADFVANMSHEIRTPMNAILSLAYLLEKHELTPVARGMVQKIHIAGRSLLGIINDILDFSKIDAQRLEIEHIPFRLADVLDNIASIMSSAVGEKPVEVVVGPAPEGANFLKGDALRLGQVLINLAGNAIKFTNEGEVVVSVAQVAEDRSTGMVRLRFAVRDTGIGIAKDKQQAIFNAFTQGDSSTSRSFGGTGLGLAISRRLVELMGGELSVASEPGKGSEFAFEIALELSDPVGNATPAMMFQRVLVADDNATARVVLSATAASLGWSVEAVDSGKKAIAAVANAGRNPYDVLLLDWRMPEVDGLAAATAIRRNIREDGSAPIIIMVTAMDREQLREQPGSEQVDAVLTKPVTCSGLYNALLDAKSRRGELPIQEVPRTGGQALAGRRILVVDDNEMNRDVAQQILVGEGAEVELAPEGSTALTMLQSHPEGFDLVLMDVQMPVMDGYETTRQIRATPSLAHLPVIALTAGAFKKQQLAAIESGMNDFVAKPFDVDELIATVQRYTGGGESAAPGAARDAAASQALLDVQAGLRNWRDEAVYRDRLRSMDFVEEGQRIVEAIQAGDTSQAAFLAHRLRGSAGALALLQAAELAGAVEEQLREGRDDAGPIAELMSALKRTAAAIEDYLGEAIEAATPGAHAPAAGANPAEARAILERVRAALDSDDPGRIEPLLPTLSTFIPADFMQQLRQCINAFDFRGAEALIQAFSESHGMTEEE